MAKPRLKNNKPSSSNGHKSSSVSAPNGKTIGDNTTGGFVAESGKSMTKADELTLRAWKKTFENRKKAA